MGNDEEEERGRLGREAKEEGEREATSREAMEEGGRERVSLMEEEEFDGGKVVGRLGREGGNK